jgi:NAD(P)-dependent dehydrogenase (short-subunit alcohol dehydrogenase family)
VSRGLYACFLRLWNSGELLELGGEDVARCFVAIGPFDHLVLSLSGGGGGGPFAELDLAQLEQSFNAKFWAYVSTLQAALPTLRSDGSATLVTAGSARSAIPGTAGLAAINGALEAMIRPLAVEPAPLRVNVVSPGIIDTPWWNAMPSDRRQTIFAQAVATLPVGRLGTADDVAEAIVLVATNGFMTGTVVECDGGGHLGPTPRLSRE